MTPPEGPVAGTATDGTASLAVSDSRKPAGTALITLTQRADFLRAARAKSAKTPSLFLQARRRKSGEAEGLRVGYTCSKKVGNAVARNRAKRRLREAARAVLPRAGHVGWDYVLIGRAGSTAARPFDLLLSDLEGALTRLHGDGS
ncbi:MAG: ribonuclease P protein component [Paracoccaceae bacterium]